MKLISIMWVFIWVSWIPAGVVVMNSAVKDEFLTSSGIVVLQVLQGTLIVCGLFAGFLALKGSKR